MPQPADPPAFTSLMDYAARRNSVEVWQDCVAAILRRHGLFDPSHEMTAGFNATWPTFLHGDVVVKLFGYLPAWRLAHGAEQAALACVATDPAIGAPRRLAEGVLSDGAAAPWPYLITGRVPGMASWRAGLSPAQRLSLARDLGRQVKRLHSIAPTGLASHGDWPAVNVAQAAAGSSLPPHLAAQAADYVARLGPPDPVFVHGDLVANHVFVADGCLSGVIDWGDAMVADRHYELIQIHRDLFGCDKELLRAFLLASDWPTGNDFARLALGQALCRQAVGMVQHLTIDVFEPVAARLPLAHMATLDELADALFAI
ncbi:MAG: aminoglycoside phosphotransferase family protein [Alphaproteobacteria bacterium]